MNSFVLSLNRLVCNSHQLSKLLNPKINLISNQWIRRDMKLWQEKTLRLMKDRSKLFEAVQRPPDPRSTLQEWNLRAELFAFKHRLHEDLTEDNLKIALTDQSFIDKEVKQRQELGLSDVSLPLKDNNDLSQIGENICESYIKPYLRHFLPRLPEDGIRVIYEYLMSEEVLSDVAKWLGCIDLVLTQEFPPKESTLAKTVRALVGTVAEDQSPKRAQNFVLDFILTYLVDKDILEIWDIPNPRFNLKDILSRERLPPMEYRLLRESAVGTIEACYVVGIYVNKELISSAPGETIEIAKQMADLEALRGLFHLKPSQVLLEFGPKAYEIDLSQSSKESLYLNEWLPSLVSNKSMKRKEIL